MLPLKVAVAGASGIGKFHAREFHDAGCELVAVLGKTPKTAQESAKRINESLGTQAKPYSDLAALLEAEKISAISICTPFALHEAQTKQCLESGHHVLCEKPLTSRITCDNYLATKKLCSLAAKKQKILTINTQWPAILPMIRGIIQKEAIEQFEFHIESGLKGIDLLMDSLPHPNSMLVGLVGNGSARNVQVKKISDQSVDVHFEYRTANQSVSVSYELRFNDKHPREIRFGINEKKFLRIVGENYQQFLKIGSKVLLIEDPLKISVQRFVHAVRNKKESPLINMESLQKNASLQDSILKKYLNQ